MEGAAMKGATPVEVAEVLGGRVRAHAGRSSAMPRLRLTTHGWWADSGLRTPGMGSSATLGTESSVD